MSANSTGDTHNRVIERHRVTEVRDRFQRGDRVALEHTGDPGTRLRPGDEGTVTCYDPGPGQFSDR
jgi:hypothetical protein